MRDCAVNPALLVVVDALFENAVRVAVRRSVEHQNDPRQRDYWRAVAEVMGRELGWWRSVVAVLGPARQRARRVTHDSVGAHLKAVYGVGAALMSGYYGPNPAAASLFEHAERLLPECPRWTRGGPPRRDVIARVLALVPREVLRRMTPEMLRAIPPGGES